MAGKASTIELTRDEIVAQLEAGAQARRGTSARELVLAYRKALLEDPGEVADLLALASLLPDEDPLFAETIQA